MDKLQVEEDLLTRHSPLQDNYQIQQQSTDPRFGDITLLVNREDSSDLIMAKTKLSQTMHDCERDVYQARERMRLSHPNLFAMLDYGVRMMQAENPVNSCQYMVIGFYEYPQHDLATEIIKRTTQQRHFTADELFRLEVCLLEVMTYLRNFKMVHGDIRPKYIAYDSGVRRQHKLVDRLGDASAPNNVQINNLRKKEPIYMSPAMYNALIHKMTKIRHNPYKSEAFSLGLVLLECGTLKSVQNIYDNGQISDQAINDLLEEFIDRYGDHRLLTNSMLWLLETDESERKDPKRVLKMLMEMQSQERGESFSRNGDASVITKSNYDSINLARDLNFKSVSQEQTMHRTSDNQHNASHLDSAQAIQNILSTNGKFQQTINHQPAVHMVANSPSLTGNLVREKVQEGQDHVKPDDGFNENELQGQDLLSQTNDRQMRDTLMSDASMRRENLLSIVGSSQQRGVNFATYSKQESMDYKAPQISESGSRNSQSQRESPNGIPTNLISNYATSTGNRNPTVDSNTNGRPINSAPGVYPTSNSDQRVIMAKATESFSDQKLHEHSFARPVQKFELNNGHSHFTNQTYPDVPLTSEGRQTHTSSEHRPSMSVNMLDAIQSQQSINIPTTVNNFVQVSAHTTKIAPISTQSIPYADITSNRALVTNQTDTSKTPVTKVIQGTPQWIQTGTQKISQFPSTTFQGSSKSSNEVNSYSTTGQFKPNYVQTVTTVAKNSHSLVITDGYKSPLPETKVFQQHQQHAKTTPIGVTSIARISHFESRTPEKHTTYISHGQKIDESSYTNLRNIGDTQVVESRRIIASPIGSSKIQTFSSILHQNQNRVQYHQNVTVNRTVTPRTENSPIANRIQTGAIYSTPITKGIYSTPITKGSEVIDMTKKSPQVYYSTRVVEHPGHSHQQLSGSVVQPIDTRQYSSIGQSKIETTPTRSSRIIVRSISPNLNGEARQPAQNNQASIFDGEENGAPMRELYIAPEKLRELKQQSRLMGASQFSSYNGVDRNEVSTFDYEIQKAENGTRKYFLKRDPSQSVIERSRSKSPNLSALKENTTSRVNIPGSPIPFRRLEAETHSGELTIEDKQLEERYSNIQLRENTSDFKVYRADSTTNKIDGTRTPVRDASPSIRASLRPAVNSQTTVYNVNSTRPSSTFVNAVIPSLVTEKR
jgi:hypothetical protein